MTAPRQKRWQPLWRSEDKSSLFCPPTTAWPRPSRIKQQQSSCTTLLWMSMNPREDISMESLTDLSRLNGLDECLSATMKDVGLAAYAHSAHTPSLILNVFKAPAAVIKLRGKEQTKTESGRRMLVQAASNLLINCIHGSIRLLGYLHILVEEPFIEAPTAGPGFEIQETMILFADLCASMKDNTIKELVAVVTRAMYLDSLPMDITKLSRQMSSQTSFQLTYHVYYDCWIAMMWNSSRTWRIMLNYAIRRALLEGFLSKLPIFTTVKHTTMFQLAIETSLNLQADILSSVPQHIC
ncbi:hypothetical protein BJ875DRAFT_148000 [Amylocarpus encephaloides]|uniref:Uncharacterized protein n=1 Tax=Amylocarpus encephaloides TaxID=45428 RepID=A0A9P7YU88_9HELO|nr:hypothetical protein BJ875DRAFT_148000 [Amylocarpus encephaloides]